MDLEKIGGYAFLLGVIIAVIAGLAAGMLSTTQAGYVALVLVILGLIVGFLNIKDKQITNFLVAAIALMVLGIATGDVATGGLAVIDKLYAGKFLVSIVANIAVFVAPAALIVALKEVYNIASGK